MTGPVGEQRVAEVSFLTGPMSGERRAIAQRTSIGPTSDCHIRQSCSHAIGKVEIYFEADAWWVESQSDKVLHNHEQLAKKRQLRSGDILRLSHAGPDFVFTIGAVSNASPPGSQTPAQTPDYAEKQQTTTPVADVRADTSAPGSEAEEVPTVRPTVDMPWTKIAIGVCAAAVVVLLAFGIWWRPEPGRFASVSVQSVAEGETLELTLREHYSGAEDNQFRLIGDPPDGMSLMAFSGTLTWETGFNIPGKYEVSVEALDSDGERVDSVVVPITITPVQRSIAVKMQPNMTALAGKPFSFQVNASVKGRPNQKFSYELDGDPQKGLSIDKTGLVTWQPDKAYSDTVQPIGVSISGDNLVTAHVRYNVVVERAPLTAEEIAAHSTYLVAAEHPSTGTIFPFALACAVRKDALLTTGAIATELARVKKKGWKIRVQSLADESWFDVDEVLVSAAFAASKSDRAEQLYVDVGLLKVPGLQRTTVSIAPPNETAKGMRLRVLATENDGEPLTKFDHKELHNHEGKVYMLTRLPVAEGIENVEAPGLVHLVGDIPENAFGSLVLDEQFRLIAVYVEKAHIPEDNPLARLRGRYHYAARLGWLRGWINGEEGDWWVEPKVVDRPAPPKKGPSSPKKNGA